MSHPHSLYWIGLYEPVCSKEWEWFFQVDLTRAICYCVLRFMGGGEEDLRLLLVSPLLTQTDQKFGSSWCTLCHWGQSRDHFVEQRSRLSIRLFPSGRPPRSLVRDIHHVHHLCAPYLVEGQSISHHLFYSKRVELTD